MHIRASSGRAGVAKLGEGTSSQPIPGNASYGLYSLRFVAGAPANIFRWPSDHNLVTDSRDDGGMRKISQEDLDALNNLVQAGLTEVVSIDEFGEPSYRIASRFLAQHFARTQGSPGVRGSAPVLKPDVRSARRRSRCPSPSVAQIKTQPVPFKGAKGERSDPLTVSATLSHRDRRRASPVPGREVSRRQSFAPPSLPSRFPLGFRLGISLGFRLGISLGFRLGISLGFHLGIRYVRNLIRGLVRSSVSPTVA